MRNLIISPAVITTGFDIAGAFVADERETLATAALMANLELGRHAKLRLILRDKFKLFAKFEGVRIFADIGSCPVVRGVVGLGEELFGVVSCAYVRFYRHDRWDY